MGGFRGQGRSTTPLPKVAEKGCSKKSEPGTAGST